MEMPVMDGHQTAARLRLAHGPDLPIIAVTANAQAQDLDLWRRLGVQGYIPKPIDQKVLDAEVCGVLNMFDRQVIDAA
jgi:CheY-like chemotaxis protein